MMAMFLLDGLMVMLILFVQMLLKRIDSKFMRYLSQLKITRKRMISQGKSEKKETLVQREAISLNQEHQRKDQKEMELRQERVQELD